MTDEKYLRYYKKKRFGIDNWLRRRAQSETKSAQRFWQAYEMLDLQLIECDHNYHLTGQMSSTIVRSRGSAKSSASSSNNERKN